jgi:hypothetical protein
MAWHSFTNVLLGTLPQLWLQLLSLQGKNKVLCGQKNVRKLVSL